MSTIPVKVIKCAAAGLCATVIGGCLPEDTFQALKFSPDGKLLAVVSQKQGLFVADPAGMETRVLANPPVDVSSISWTTDSQRLAFTASFDGSLDVYVTSLHGKSRRLTSSPSRESHPMVHGETVLLLTTVSGRSELTTRSLSIGEADVTGPQLPQTDRHLIAPALSPDKKYVAAFGFEHLRPQIYLIDTMRGEMEQLTRENDVFGLISGSLTWKADSSAIGYLRNAIFDRNSFSGEGTNFFPGAIVAAGASFHVRKLEEPEAEKTLISRADGIRSACFDQDNNVVFSNGSRLMLNSPDGPGRVLSLDLEAALPTPGGDGGTIAFVAAHQLLGLTTASLERARLLTFDLEDKFLLAEEYFRSGSQSKSYDLYEELRASVQRTRDPAMARFIYIANLRRLGRTDKAVAEIEKLLQEDQVHGSVPEKYLWRLLGFSYLLELDDLEKAAESLSRYQQLTSGTEVRTGEDSAMNALEIIRETSAPVTQLYASAVKARLDGNFDQTDRLFGELLTTAPEVLAVQREYINALDGFDTQVYFFSPSQRPFRPGKSQRAEYLERLVNLVPDSPLAHNARLDLFLLRIEMGSYSRARALLNQALDSVMENGRPEGILQVFFNYLETPELLPWINQAMPEVFLHETIRPRLEALTQAPQDRLLLRAAATKLALLQNLPGQARQEADAALAEWNRIPPDERDSETAGIYGRLLVMRAREAELRGLYAEASDAYDHAAHELADKQADYFELQEEIRYRASLLRTLLSDHPEAAARMHDIELRTGMELINPTWEADVLKGAVQEYVNLYDTTSSTLRQWSAYEAGVLLSKLHRHQQARAALVLAASDSAPEFLQRKAMLELAALDEYENDPWNAARWYSRMASFPGTAEDFRMWCSYHIARLHLSINYNIPAAREALAVIVSNRSDTPLAIQAQELLISTSTR